MWETTAFQITYKSNVSKIKPYSVTIGTGTNDGIRMDLPDSFQRTGYRVFKWKMNGSKYPVGTVTNGEWMINHIAKHKYSGITSVTCYAVWTKDRSKIIMIGDSYAYSWNTNWPKYVADSLGMNEYNYRTNPSGGSGFETGEGFENQLNAEAGKMTKAGRKSVKFVIVCGGYNDAWLSSSKMNSLSASVKHFITTAHALFPKAKILVGMIGWDRDNYANANYSKLPAVAQAYRDGVKMSGSYADYIDSVEYLFRWVTTPGLYRQDEPGDSAQTKADMRVHPTTVGGQELGWRIASVIQ